MKNKTQNRISMVRQSLVFSVIVILFLSISNGIYSYMSQTSTYKAELAFDEEFYLDRELQIAKTEINSIESYIANESTLWEESLRAKVKERVEEAHEIANHLYVENRNQIDEVNLRKLIATALGNLKYDGFYGYYFICQPTGDNVLLDYGAFSENESPCPSDPEGGDYFKAKASSIIASEEKQGFMEWYWEKPGESSGTFRKIGYIMHFEPYDWYIGTGIYVIDAENALKSKILDTLSKIYSDVNQYVFIGKTDGEVLLAPYEMDNFYELGKSGEHYIWDIIKDISDENEGYVDYELPESALGYSYSKTSYVLYIPQWDWYTGTGINLDLLDSQNRLKSLELRKIIRHSFTVNIILSLASFIVAIYFFAYFNKSLRKEFRLMDNFLSGTAEKHRRIDSSKFKYNELFQLANTGNKMMEEIEIQQMKLEKYSERMNLLAKTDSLTNLLNHRAIIENLQMRMHEADRYATPLSTIMLDIDDFKNINDTYGHPFGDTVLVKVASTLKESLRETDLIGRYGGEEFLVLLPNTDLEDAWQAAEKIRKSIEALVWDKQDFKVTISGGVSEYKDRSNKNLIGDADTKLYMAKSLGKNMMVK